MIADAANESARRGNDSWSLVAVLTPMPSGDCFRLGAENSAGHEVAVLVTSRQQVRQFPDPKTALRLVKQLGFATARIKVDTWLPSGR
jgi:hypothetical protein